MSPPAVVRVLPCGPGVYRFRDGAGRVLYIGRAVDLRRRVGSYWGQLPGRRHLRRMVAMIERVEAIECESGHDAAWLERSLLGRTKPRWNRTIGGQELPVHLRLDRSARSPGLTVVHDLHPGPEITYYGPYLGSTAVRAAARGVHRVHPVALAAPGASGSVADMARLRGVSPDQLTDLADRIAAVLQRDPTQVQATRTELTARRDQAVQGLAFEHAAVIQEELRGLEWVLASIRTAQLSPVSPADAGVVITGWAGGCAVDLRIADGVVDRWTIRRCGPGAAADRMAATPVQWRPFVDQAAGLAARLMASS